MKVHRSVVINTEYVDQDREYGLEGEPFAVMKKKYTRFKSVDIRDDTALPTLRSS